jgi:hypothetical protein
MTKGTRDCCDIIDRNPPGQVSEVEKLYLSYLQYGQGPHTERPLSWLNDLIGSGWSVAFWRQADGLCQELAARVREFHRITELDPEGARHARIYRNLTSYEEQK